MYQIQFDPIDLILACPHKWYLLEQVNSGIVAKASLYDNPHMRRVSVDRHTKEMINEGLVELSSDGYISITDKGAKIARELKQMKNAYQKKVLA